MMNDSNYFKNNILTIPIKMSVHNNKKKPQFPSGWNKLCTVEECKRVFEDYPKYRSIALLTGKKNKITIIDVDIPEEWENLIDSLNWHYPDNGIIVDTKRGFHLYFQYDERLPNIQHIVNGIDIKNDNANCTVPPSYYILDNDEKITYKFRDGTIEENVIKMNDLPKMPEVLVNKFLEQHTKLPKKMIKIKDNNLIQEKILKINRYLNKLKRHELDNYKCVNKLILFICQYSESSDKMLQFVKKYFCQTKYEDQIEYQWKNISLNNETDKAYNSFKKFIRELMLNNLETDYFEQDILLELLKKRVSLAIDYINRHFGIIISNDNGRTMYCEIEYINDIMNNIILISTESNLTSKFPKSIAIQISEKKSKPFIQYWLEHYDRKTYRKIIFEPFTQNVKNNLNLENLNMYLGFKNEFIEQFKVDKKKIQFPLRHLNEVLCDNDKNVSEYLLNWLAHILQKPNERMGIAVLCKSIQGVGKNLFFEHLIGNLIIGNNHSINIADSNQVVGQFNSILERMIFTIVNELKSDGDIIKMSNYMKSLITDKSQKIEKKGIDAIYTNNYNNFVFLTNNHNVVNIELHDRRYLCIESSSRYIRNEQYRKTMVDSLTNEETGLHFFHYLMKRDIKDFNFRDIPMTTYKKQLMQNSIPSIMNWFSKFLKNYITHNTNELDKIDTSLDELFEKYRVESNGNILKMSTFKTQLLDDMDKGLSSIQQQLINETIHLTIYIKKTFQEMKNKNYLIEV
tara:strand:+ start:270 stop:2492 length:2223 start_codon:yes stop_codon:yes gene_type:complete